MKTLLIILILLLPVFLQAMPYASAHGICGGIPPRYVHLEHTTLSKQTLQTGENFTITGNMTALTGNDLKGKLFLQTKPSPHGRLVVPSIEPSSGIFDIPGNSTIPYSITVTALLPGSYFVSSGLDLIGIGPSLLNNGCSNTIEPNLTVTGSPICIQGFVAVIKAEDDSPACVKPDTAQILIERGWGFMRGVQTFFPLGNIENDTTQPLIPPSQLPHLPLGNLPVNKTVLAFSKIPNWNKKFVCEKYTGSAIQITAEISNALKFSGTVTDPKGVIHDILPIALNNTQMQIQFSASTSDPDGSYVVAFKVVNGSNTSNVNFYCWGSMVENGTTYPGLHPLPP